MQPGPLKCPKVSPRSQHCFGFRSPPRLELATPSSQTLPPDSPSAQPALAFQVPIRSFSHGCSAVLRSWASRSPRPRCVSLLRIYPSDPVPTIAYMLKPPPFFSSRLVSCCDVDDPFPPAPRCCSGHHMPPSVVCTPLDTVPVAIPVLLSLGVRVPGNR